MDSGSLYLRLLKRCLTRDLFPDRCWDKALENQLPFDRAARDVGGDWPTEAVTMVGMRRLENLEACVLKALEEGVPGDLVETGVWRGGCGILMRALLKVRGEKARLVWLADSFQGLPEADPATYPKDLNDEHTRWTPYLGVPQETVADNFRMYELLDEQVRFLKGWFRDTLPTAPMKEIAVLRLDGDMYEATIVALNSLYPKLSPGGFVIIDDFGALPNCRAAVEDYRAQHEIHAPMTHVDWTGVYWRKGG